MNGVVFDLLMIGLNVTSAETSFDDGHDVDDDDDRCDDHHAAAAAAVVVDDVVFVAAVLVNVLVNDLQ